jgi:hypothetical protein
MSRPTRPLRGCEIVLPPTTFIGGDDHLIVRHDNDPKNRRSFGVVIMAPAGLSLLNSRMRPLDKAVLITVVSKLQWFKIDYGETRSGKTWTLCYAKDGEHVIASVTESGIATTGLSFQSIANTIRDGSDRLIEILSEAKNAITGEPIDRDRAARILNASKKSIYSVSQVERSISNLKALGIIIGDERAGPDSLYYILNPFFYCNGPVFMRNALIRLVTNTDTGGIINFSVDLTNVGRPRRRKTNAELIQELERKTTFINDVLKIQALPEEMYARGHQLLGDG